MYYDPSYGGIFFIIRNPNGYNDDSEVEFGDEYFYMLSTDYTSYAFFLYCQSQFYG
jgi:hypothetical protein